MLNDLGPNLDVQGLMHEIRANVANQQRPLETTVAPVATNGHSHYHVNHLLRFHGEDFVRNAYLTLLGREPDGPGMAHYMEQLASGHFNKVDVLASLHLSPEGRGTRVKLEGLSLPVAVRRLGRIPVLGYFVRIAVGIARLPRLVQHQNRFEFYTWSQQRSIVTQQNQQYGELRDSLQQISAQLLEMMQRAAEQQQARELSLRQYEEFLADYHEFKSAIETHLTETRKQSNASTLKLAEQIGSQSRQLSSQQQLIGELQRLLEKLGADVAPIREEIREELNPLTTRQERTDVSLLMQERRLTVLLDQVKRNAGALRTEVAADELNHLMDHVYASFEDQFRGSREEIHQRLRVYVPYLKDAAITK